MSLSASDLVDHQLLAKLGRLTFESRRAMAGHYAGRHKSPFRGSSVDFSQYRQYVPGDDIRHIDWRVYARTERHFVKEFEADTNLRCHMLLDCSGSMSYAGKLDLARRLSATLANVLIHQGDAVGVQAFNERLANDVPAKSGPRHLRLLCEALAKTQPAGPTRLSGVLDELAGRIRRRAQMIIFSDLFLPLEPLAKTLGLLAHRRHDVSIFHFMDRQELEFDFDQPTRFVGLEGEDSIMVEPELMREAYLRAVTRHMEGVREICHRNGVDYRPVRMGTPSEDILGPYLLERLQRKGGGR